MHLAWPCILVVRSVKNKNTSGTRIVMKTLDHIHRQPWYSSVYYRRILQQIGAVISNMEVKSSNYQPLFTLANKGTLPLEEHYLLGDGLGTS